MNVSRGPGEQAQQHAAAVRHVIAQLRAHSAEVWTADDIAAEMHFSAFHANRVFRRVTGVAPGRFLTALRLDESKRLLLDEGAYIGDICTAVGYRSVGSFTTLFNRRVGLSPSEFRLLARLTQAWSVRDLFRHACALRLTAALDIVDSDAGDFMFIGEFSEAIPAADVILPRSAAPSPAQRIAFGYVLDGRAELGEVARGALAHADKLAVIGGVRADEGTPQQFRQATVLDPPVLADAPLILAKASLSR